MGLGNNNGRFTYVNISKGRLVIKKDNEYVFFGFIEGYVKDLEIRDDEYQGKKYKKLCLMINDGTEDYQLQMKLDSGYGIAFCMMAKNIDFKKAVKISPTYEVKDDKGKAGLFINQDGKALKWFFTKATPHDLPQMTQVEFKGEKHWDNTQQQAYFIDMLVNGIKPTLDNSIVGGAPHQLDQTQNHPEASGIGAPVDDLPF